MTILSERIMMVGGSPIHKFAAKAKAMKADGIDIISLGMGEPDFNTPDYIKKAGIKAIEDNITKYTPVDGDPKLKVAIAAKLKRSMNTEYQAKEITVGNGATQMIFNCFGATINPNDEVIIAAPYWPQYKGICEFLGGKAIIIQTSIKNNLKITADQLEKAITAKTKWLVITSPCNPTGICYNRQELESLSKVLLQHSHVHILSDDIYEYIIEDDIEFCNIPMVCQELRDRTIVINGASKGYCMTGWRIGYAAGNSEIIGAMKNMQSRTTSCPSSISQFAVTEALNNISIAEENIEKNRIAFNNRRLLFMQKLDEITGLTYAKPQGAFYIMVSCESFIGKTTKSGKKIKNSEDFMNYLLDEYLVFVIAGSAFGAEGQFRISYPISEDKIEEAAKRIREACENIR